MSLLKIFKNWKQFRCISRELGTLSTNEVTEKVEYPPIEDLSYYGRKNRQRIEREKELHNVETIEERLIKLNMPRYYGWKGLELNDNILLPYDPLPFIQYCTRTHFIEQSELPNSYKNINVDNNVRQKVQQAVEDVIQLHLNTKQTTTAILVRQLNRAIINSLAASYPHMLNVQIDLDPRHEAFWFLGGIDPSAVTLNSKKKNWLKDYANDPIEWPIHYSGQPLLSLRGTGVLKPITTPDQSQAAMSDVPEWHFDPRVQGYACIRRPAIITPGYWPGEQSPTGLLQILSSFAEDCVEKSHARAILAAFAWSAAQAFYSGASPLMDPEVPVITQSIVTDGEQWKFYTYQLNATALHKNGNVANLCWGTSARPLWEKKMGETGEIITLNQDVLNHLISYYCNVPDTTIELKKERIVADLEDDERRVWLENRFKQLTSNRPRHLLPYELFHWEKIYKLDHNTRPMEPRRRPFELGINPFRRKLDEHLPPYVPKAIRPNFNIKRKKFNRWAKTYYP